MELSFTPIIRALKFQNSLHARYFAEKRWNTSIQNGLRIEQNNRELCNQLNEFYRDVYGDNCKYCIIRGKLHLLSSDNLREIDDLTARKLIQDMRQGNKDGSLNLTI